MLDFNVSLEFNPDIKVVTKSDIDALIITSCAIHISANDDRMYSDFDDQTFNKLNCATDDLGFIDFEIGFAGYSGKPYPKVYTKCFMLYTDNFQLIKPMKMNNHTSESKINQRGETVIGIRYYFKTRDEIQKIISCNNLLFDGFLALGKPQNTYAFVCQLQKKEEIWTAKYANTYRPHYAKNIKGLID